MLGILPEELTINGKEYPINTDYRIALIIMEACGDENLTEYDKALIIIENLYEHPEEIEDYEEALKQAGWYLDGGRVYQNNSSSKQIISWTQDEPYIFSAVNKVAGREIRADEHMHWWTFLGLFQEIGEGTLSTIINIRNKLNKGKKLDKVEEEYYKENREMIVIHRQKTEEEKEKENELEKKLGIKFH